MSLSAPSIQVEKVPSLASVPETGADVTFTFTVTNTSNELPLTITSLVDDAFGNLDGDADCQLGTRLAAGAFCAFSSFQEIKGDFSGPDHSNTFTAHAKDPFQTDVLDNVLATVAFTDTLPTLLVEKTPSVDSVVETGAELAMQRKI